MNPFLVLGVGIETTDEEVRAAYRALLRRFTPEHRPVQFQMIQEAYNVLRTERDRIKWRLSHVPKESQTLIEVVDNFSRVPGAMRPPGATAFRSFLQGCAAASLRAQSTCPPTHRQPSSRP